MGLLKRKKSHPAAQRLNEIYNTKLYIYEQLKIKISLHANNKNSIKIAKSPKLRNSLN